MHCLMEKEGNAQGIGIRCGTGMPSKPDWAGGLGVMVEIIGATCYAAENQYLPPYAVPTQPISRPWIPINPATAQIRTITDEKTLLNRDWDVVRGFRRGVSENICDALDLEFFG